MSGPFVAHEPGLLPENGSPTLAGIKLPHGHRLRPKPLYPSWVGPSGPPTTDLLWHTDDKVIGWHQLCRSLVEAFPQTGLWPLIWEDWPDPLSSFSGPRCDLLEIDHFDPAAILAEAWDGDYGRPFGVNFPFPGLAPPTAANDSPSFDPFRAQADWYREHGKHGSSRAAVTVMVVPCLRPADIVAELGWHEHQLPSLITECQLASVLRSWEERFHAVLTALGSSWLSLGVRARPSDYKQALSISYEHYALAGDIEEGSFENYAMSLMSAPNRETWSLSWP